MAIISQSLLTRAGIQATDQSAEELRVSRLLGNRRASERRHSRGTFIVEALLLFVCVLIIVAISLLVLSFSAQKGADAAHLDRAIVLATNTAERFSADPMFVPSEYKEGDYTVECQIEVDINDIGAMYDATIDVFYQSEDVYTLNVSRYVSKQGDEDGSLTIPQKSSEVSDSDRDEDVQVIAVPIPIRSTLRIPESVVSDNG